MKTRARATPDPPFAWTPIILTIRVSRLHSPSAMRLSAYLWYVAGLCHRRTDLPITAAQALRIASVSRPRYFPTLRLLEEHEFVLVTRRPRHSTLVTLPSNAVLSRWEDD